MAQASKLSSFSATPDVAAEVRGLLESDLGHSEVATALAPYGLSVSRDSVRRWREKHLGRSTPPTGAQAPTVAERPVLTVEDADTDQTSALEAQNADLRAANARLYKQYLKSKKRGDDLVQAVFNAAKDAAVYVGQTPAVPPAPDLRDRDAEVALWHLTDWQGGKRTSSYNRDVMDDRLEVFVEKAHKITEIQRADHPVKHGVVLFTGDMVEGVSIFPGQAWELDGTLFEQMFHVSDRIEWCVRQALNIYETVDVICEWGNHGRLGKKGDGLKASDNVDRMTYQIAKDRLANESRIGKFQVSGDWYQHFTVGNYRAMAIHGDEIKSFGGNVPAYGILRKANAWAGGVVPQFRDLYIGHYHQSMQLQLANGGSVFMTGSTESDSEYAREFVAATGLPSQRINFIDPEAGQVTAEYKIWL